MKKSNPKRREVKAWIYTWQDGGEQLSWKRMTRRAVQALSLLEEEVLVTPIKLKKK